MDQVEYCHIQDCTCPPAVATPPEETKGAGEQNHYRVVENMVNVLKGRAHVTTNALEGLKVVDMIERIYRA